MPKTWTCSKHEHTRACVDNQNMGTTEDWVRHLSSVLLYLGQYFAFPWLTQSCKWGREVHGQPRQPVQSAEERGCSPLVQLHLGTEVFPSCTGLARQQTGDPSWIHAKRRHTLVWKVETLKCRTRRSEAGIRWAGKVLPKSLSGALTHSSQWVSPSRSMKQDAAYGKNCK